MAHAGFLRVAASELATLFAVPAREATDEPEVFTLDAREVYFEPLGEYVPGDPDLPPDALGILNALVNVQSILAVLLEETSTGDPKSMRMAGYAAAHQRYANWLAKQPVRGQRRRQTLAAFVSDLGHGLRDVATAAGLDDTSFATWVDERAEEELRSLPYLGRRRELVHFRLVNPSDRWEGNDLVDVVSYLRVQRNTLTTWSVRRKRMTTCSVLLALGQAEPPSSRRSAISWTPWRRERRSGKQ